MGLSDFEYTAAWSVGSLVAFGLLTIGCKQIPAFGASPSFAAHMIVHVFLVCAICHYAGLTQRAPLSTVDVSQTVPIRLGASSAAQPGPPEETAWMRSCALPNSHVSDQLLHCVNDRLLQPRRAAGLDHRAASHAPGAHVQL